MRTLTILAAGALLTSAPLAAQQHGAHAMPMQQHGQMQQCMDMMGGPHPQMLLHHRDQLELTDAQVTQLEQLNARVQQNIMPHMQPAMQAHMAAAELLKGDTPDFAAYEAKLREIASHMVEAHSAMARIAVETRQLLTDEQLAELESLEATMMGGGQHGMMGGGQHGMMGQTGQDRMGHAGMGGMMMGCMMMGMGQTGSSGQSR